MGKKKSAFFIHPVAYTIVVVGGFTLIFGIFAYQLSHSWLDAFYTALIVILAAMVFFKGDFRIK